MHLLANSDAGFEGFPRNHLFRLTWNPERLFEALSEIPGLTEARTVGVDGMSPGMHELLRALLPQARIVDAGPIMAELWALQSPEKVHAVHEAARVASTGLAAMAAFLRDGVRARVLRGVCAERFGSLGVTTPAFEAVAAPIDGGASTWLPPERLLGAGESVALRAGALRDGWEASLAHVRCRRAVRGAVAARRMGRGARALPARHPRRPAPRPRGRDLRRGPGRRALRRQRAAAAGMVCALELHQGNRLHQETLQITDGTPTIFTAAPRR